MKAINYFLLFVSLLSFSSLKAQVNFYATAPSTAYVDEDIQVSFVIENSDFSHFSYPKFKGFEIIQGPLKSSMKSTINGKTTTNSTFYFIIRPIKEGNFTISQASIIVKGKTIYTKSLNITVKTAKPKQNNFTPTPSNRGGNSSNLPENENWKEQVSKDVFVKLYADNTQPYVGEQIILYAKIYHRVDLYGLQGPQMPNLKSFWNEEIEINKIQKQYEVHNGLQYQTFVIAKYALFPLKEGNFIVDPIKMATILRIDEPTYVNILGEPFLTSQFKQVQYNFASEALTIQVKPLPLEGKPKNFYGAVGNFSLQSSLDSSEVNLGNACQYQVKLSGKGNFMVINDPNIAFPKEFSVFDPEVKEQILNESNYIQGEVQYNYYLVPEQPGSFNIPSFQFSFFDPKSRTYKTLETDSFTLKVKGELNDKKVFNEILASEETFPIKSENSKTIKSKSFVGSTSYFAAYSAPLLLYFLFIVGMKKRKEYLTDLVNLKNKRASKEAQKRMEMAKIFLAEKNKTRFYNEVFNVLNQYVSDKFNIPRSQLTKEFLLEKFSATNLSEQNKKSYFSILRHAEEALYSPISQDKMQEDYDTLIQLIIKMEHELA